MKKSTVRPLPESEFPTVRDLAEAVKSLIELGLGEHPVQLVVIPDSTLQSIVISALPHLPDDQREKLGDNPALMIERDGVSFISTKALERLGGNVSKRARH